ncbi:MAG: hypothetical protein WCD20_14260 [Rhodomicrobium sp.]
MSYWFRPKRYGWGATPANWKGWVAIGVFVAVILAVNLELARGMPLIYFAIFGALLALFGWIVWKKTDGVWRWRWGPDEKEK